MIHETIEIEIALRDLKAPGLDLLEPLREIDYRYAVPADKEIFSEKTAEKLISKFPLTVFGKQNEVIGSIRVYQIITAVFGEHSDKIIRVEKIKTSKLTRAELREIACEEEVLPTETFSLKDPAPTFYAFKVNLTKFGLTQLNFFKEQSIRSMAKMLNVSKNTLQKLVRRIKKNEKM